jgi:hypothetical protein
MDVEIDLLRALAGSIERGDRVGLEKAGSVISGYLRDRNGSAWFLAKIEELAELWVGAFNARGMNCDPITCKSLPAMIRAADRAVWPAPEAPSLTPYGREVAKTPMTYDEIAAFQKQISTEDGLREWCIYGRRSCHEGLVVEPLLVIEGEAIHGQPIARLYRARQIDRWWQPELTDPERAMIADLLILLVHQYVVDRERVYSRIAGCLQPYLRNYDREAALQEARCAALELAGLGVIRGGPGESWKATAAIGQRAAESLGVVWRRSSGE